MSNLTINPVRTRDAFALAITFFPALYKNARESNYWQHKPTNDEVAAYLGLKANKPIMGIFKHINNAAIVLCALSRPLRFISKCVEGRETDMVLGYHGYVVKDQKGAIIALATLERDPDPEFQNRGHDTSRVEACLYLSPDYCKNLEQEEVLDAVTVAVAVRAAESGYKTLEIVVAMTDYAAQCLSVSLAAQPIGQKVSPPPLGRRALMAVEL